MIALFPANQSTSTSRGLVDSLSFAIGSPSIGPEGVTRVAIVTVEYSVAEGIRHVALMMPRAAPSIGYSPTKMTNVARSPFPIQRGAKSRHPEKLPIPPGSRQKDVLCRHRDSDVCRKRRDRMSIGCVLNANSFRHTNCSLTHLGCLFRLRLVL